MISDGIKANKTTEVWAQGAYRIITETINNNLNVNLRVKALFLNKTQL